MLRKDRDMNYEYLKVIYEISQQICDPIEFQVRHQALLYGITEYLLERDKPKDIINEE